MEKPLFPMEYIRITQGYNEGTHIDSYAIDNAGKDYGISDVKAPFTGIIKKIYQNDANEVWLESKDIVEYPDGTKDYMNINLFVGKEINKGEVFYHEGTKGNATGNHCHIECGRGKMTDNGWHKNNNGYWSINNGKKPEECLWIDDTIKIINTKGYIFKKISTESVEKETKEPVIIPNEEKTVEKKFIAPKTDLYGVYLKKDQELVIKEL